MKENRLQSNIKILWDETIYVRDTHQNIENMLRMHPKPQKQTNTMLMGWNAYTTVDETSQGHIN
jgi:hypothetical protein